MKKIHKHGDLRIWHIPQVPMMPFRLDVDSIAEAGKVLNILADYDNFEFENRVKGDYSNMSGLEVYEDDEWIEWYCEDGEDISCHLRMGTDLSLLDTESSVRLPRCPVLADYFETCGYHDAASELRKKPIENSEESIIIRILSGGPMPVFDIWERFNKIVGDEHSVNIVSVRRLLIFLREKGEVSKIGMARGTKYCLPGDAP
jgi:hypothetical protein